jgi:cyclophilin family peptidyl-prolyl cis-trans isomerase
LTVLFVALAGEQCLQPVQTVDVDPLTRIQAKPRVRLQTTQGEIVLELYPDQAPLAVDNFLRYVRDGFYNNTVVHEALVDTSITAGVYDTGYAAKGTRDPIDNESNNGLSNLRGRVAVVEPDGPGTGTAAFLIHIADQADADFNPDDNTPGMTVFGRVLEGMDIVEAIGNVYTAARQDTKGNVLSRTPAENVVINAATVETSETTEGNNAPVANAGADRLVQSNVLVILDGSGSSDLNGDAITFAWRQIAGPAVTLSRTDVLSPSFVPDHVARLTFELTATDEHGATSTDSVDINVNAPNNQPPVAEAGPAQPADAGDTVTLDGSESSDPDFQILTYAWTQTSGSTVVLNNATTAQPTFTAPSARGKLTFELTVTDALGGQATDTATVIVNDVPANAGADQNVLTSTAVTLHATAEAGATLAWRQQSGTAVTLSSDSAAAPSFIAPDESGPLTFRLTATSTSGAQTTDDVTIFVYVETASGLRYCDVVKGTGDVIQETSTIKALYTGRLNDQNGTKFDSTADRNNVPSQFSLQQVIDGWTEGLGNYDMRVGGKRLLIIPPDLGYGAAGRPPEIPPNSTLWFEVEVTDLVS